MKTSQEFYGISSFKNLTEVIPWYSCKNLFIIHLLISTCKRTLSSVISNQNLWMYFCSVQHVLYTPPMSSTCSQCSENHEATYYDVIFCESLSHTPTHMNLQEILTAGLSLIIWIWLFKSFKVLCLCDTLYFKCDGGKLKRSSINR